MLIVGIAGGTGSGKTKFADLIIPRGGENQIGIEVLISIIEKHLLTSKS